MIMNPLILAFLAACLHVASEPEAPPRTFALVVGIDRYADEQIKPRRHAEHDAQALAELLAGKDHALSDQVQVSLLLGSKKDQRATRENIVKSLRDVTARARANDLVLFAFLGQGAPAGQRLAFFAADSTFADRAANALTSADIEQALDGLKTRRFAALLDVNFKDFDAGAEKLPDANLNTLFRTFLGCEPKPDQPPPAGRVVCLASANRRNSLDLDEQGVFTRAVIEGLRGAADNAGYEPDGIVTAEELLTHLARRIPELARAHGPTREAKEQTPLVLGSRRNTFAVGRNPAAAAKARERLDRFAALVQQHDLPLELNEEGMRLLRQMPKLPGEQELRKVYQRLADGGLAVPAFARQRVAALAGRQHVRADAEAYAKKVLEAVRFVRGMYVQELDANDLVARAGTGLLTRANDPRTLTAMKERLDACRGLPDDALFALLADAREELGRRPDLANRRDLELSMLEIAGRLDTYSGYVEAARVADFKRLVSGTSTGIGVRVATDAKSKQLQVVTPIKDGPAYKAGIRGGDLISQIVRETDAQGKKLDKPDVAGTKGMAVGDAAQRLSGPPGSTVKLLIERAGKDEPFEVVVTRGPVEEETVFGVRRKDDDTWDWRIDPENRIGYLRLTQFNGNTAPGVRKALRDLEADGIGGLVLDLRSNPGGLLHSAVEISKLFIDDGLIVTIRPRAAGEKAFHGDVPGKYQQFPMAVLVNGQSASASEVVSACLQDHQRAVIVGERSFGKGTVQNYMDFPMTGGLLRLTTASFWRPSGINLHRASTRGGEADAWGVRPNPGLVVPLPAPERTAITKYQKDVEIIPCRDGQPVPDLTAPKDRQLDAALEYLRRQIETAREAPAKKAA